MIEKGTTTYKCKCCGKEWKFAYEIDDETGEEKFYPIDEPVNLICIYTGDIYYNKDKSITLEGVYCNFGCFLNSCFPDCACQCHKP